MTQPTPTTCKECGATTTQEAKARCTRTSAKDTCHGCELWPDEIAFDAPNPLTVEGVQALADHLAAVEPMTEPPVDDTLALAAIIRQVDGNHSLGAAVLAEAILECWVPPVKVTEKPTIGQISDLTDAIRSHKAVKDYWLNYFGMNSFAAVLSRLDGNDSRGAAALAENILRHWQPPQAPKAPEPAIELLKRALDRLPCDSDSDNALINEIWYFLRKFPPCEECGAMTAKESETRCHASSYKDECHGCDLWPDDDSNSMQPAAQPAPTTERTAIIARLRELVGAVIQGPDTVRREFDMRVPAEPLRDADLVLSTAARMLEADQSQPPPPPSTEKLFSELDQLLDGIDRCNNHPEGGWWQTEDGAKVGRIKLRELQELITRHLSPPQP
jgi:hypothetical protein